MTLASDRETCISGAERGAPSKRSKWLHAQLSIKTNMGCIRKMQKAHRPTPLTRGIGRLRKPSFGFYLVVFVFVFCLCLSVCL